jgi:DNA-binding NtrC family response regulator
LSRNKPEGAHPILIVEDDELIRVSLEDRFRFEGFGVASAATVDGARRELASACRPSLVITDVRLPDGNGSEVFELCQKILPGAPVIIMTAFGSVVSKSRSISMILSRPCE